MNRQTIFRITAACLFFAYLLFFFSGIRSIPFHPDEATQIYTSEDVLLFFSHTSDLFFSDTTQTNLRQHYRLIDAPLTHTSIGLVRLLTNQNGLPADWNWSEDWETNRQNGSLPSTQLLLTARWACTWFVPFSLLAFFQVCRKFSNRWLSLLFTILLGMHPLVLLHTRRAMAEGWLFALSLILLWLILTDQKKYKTILAILVIGILFQVKQISMPFILAAGIILIFRLWKSSGWKTAIATGFWICLSLGLFFYLLNPVMWKQSAVIAQTMISQRFEFSSEQTEQFAQHQSGLALTSPGLRLAAILGQVFFAPPAFFDTGNYQKELQVAIQSYNQNKLNIFLSGWTWGTLFLILTLCGLVVVIKNLIKKPGNDIQSAILFIFVIQTVFFAFVISMGFQRYYILFLPLEILLCISFITDVITKFPKRDMEK